MTQTALSTFSGPVIDGFGVLVAFVPLLSILASMLTPAYKTFDVQHIAFNLTHGLTCSCVCAAGQHSECLESEGTLETCLKLANGMVC